MIAIGAGGMRRMDETDVVGTYPAEVLHRAETAHSHSGAVDPGPHATLLSRAQVFSWTRIGRNGLPARGLLRVISKFADG